MSLVEKARARVQSRRVTETLGDRLRARVPLRARWRLPDPGDIFPITDEEAELCGKPVSALQKAIQVRLDQRSKWEQAEAIKAWENVKAPNRTRGILSQPIPVKWQGDPEPDNDIPF